MTTSTSDVKAVRLLGTGAVTVTRVSPTRVDATVQGDTDRRRVVGTPNGWTCDCPGWGYRRTCSHMTAVARVVDRPAPLDHRDHL